MVLRVFVPEQEIVFVPMMIMDGLYLGMEVALLLCTMIIISQNRTQMLARKVKWCAKNRLLFLLSLVLALDCCAHLLELMISRISGVLFWLLQCVLLAYPGAFQKQEESEDEEEDESIVSISSKA
jgi:Ca2+/Na+ antiporter